jgi:PiT family inorganic phosphate transporter
MLVVAGFFALFTGTNDGGALLAVGLKLSSLRPATAIAALSVTVAAAPAVFGTQVATTLADRLVSFTNESGRLAMLAAVVGATVVVVALSRRALPTSLTLALIGGIVGAGGGAGLPVAWDWVTIVLLLAAAAPLAGFLGATGIGRLWAALPVRADVGRQVRAGHRLGFILLAFAYGANDGQKMLAVVAIAANGAAGGEDVQTRWPVLVGTAMLFAAGALLRVRRYAWRLGSAVLPITPLNAVTAQLSSAAAVMGSATVGAPVSMTQALTGGLIAGGLTAGAGRIRWHQVAGIAAAWIVTLPVAAGMAALLATLFVRLS